VEEDKSKVSLVPN